MLSESSKTLRLGALSMSIETLESSLLLPEGYKIVSLHYDEVQRKLNIILTSDELPEVREGREIPHVYLQVTQMRLPNFPDLHEYRKITAEIVKGFGASYD